MDAAEAEKARKKEIHRKSMIVTGALIAGSGLAAAWLGFAPSWLVPRLKLGGGAAPRPDVEAHLAPMAVLWEPFGAQALERAQRQDRLVLLDLAASWSAASRVMDGTAYAEPAVAQLVSGGFVAVRVDADERPDLAMRYLGNGWPTTALLLPSGDVLADGTFMDGDLLRRWATEIDQKYRERKAEVLASLAAARKQRQEASAGKPLEPAAAADRAARELAATWSGEALFPRFDRLRALSRLKTPWAAALEKQGRAAALSLQDQDGGFFRVRGRSPLPELEKRLGDQAEGLAYLAEADPGAAARLRAFIDEKLALPGGGYRAAVWPDGRDDRAFCDESARMAAAVLGDPAATPAEKTQARRTIELFWSGRQGGLARRGVRQGPSGLLGDQLGLLEALLAAGRRADARALESALERRLLTPEGGAFYDRLAAGELSADVDRIPFGGLNARALRDVRAMGLRVRSRALEAWLWSHAEGLDAGELAVLAQGDDDDRSDSGRGAGGGRSR